MTPEEIKAIFDAVCAAFALAAAAAWFRASTLPVGVDGAPVWVNDKVLAQMRACGERILRGAAWNRRAAFLAGMSALSSAVS